jgi:hypothetical protein
MLHYGIEDASAVFDAGESREPWEPIGNENCWQHQSRHNSEVAKTG